MKNVSIFKVFFIMFAVLALSLTTYVNYVDAKPPGVKEEPGLGKMLKKFNVIALPENSNWGDSNASCNGARIFFQEDNGNTLGTILWTLTPGQNPWFSIYDCNGTDGDAQIDVSESVKFKVFLRVHGSYNSSLDLVCEDDDIDNGGTPLCLIASENIKKGKSMTKIMQNVVDGVYQEVLWSLSGDWKIFEVRLYEWLD